LRSTSPGSSSSIFINSAVSPLRREWDRAQIGRAIASGDGWRTKLARPLAVGQFRDIVKGEYRDWAVVIQGNQVLEKFPLKWNTVALSFDNECIFLSDHDRAHPATQ
jgi:hypothetical protein